MNYTMLNPQKRLINLVLKNPDQWISYATDKKTVEIVSATYNLGIIMLNSNDQLRLKSKEKAERFLNN